LSAAIIQSDNLEATALTSFSQTFFESYYGMPNVQAGHAIVVFIGGTNAGTVTSITDNYGNNYQQIPGAYPRPRCESAQWYCDRNRAQKRIVAVGNGDRQAGASNGRGSKAAIIRTTRKRESQNRYFEGRNSRSRDTSNTCARYPSAANSPRRKFASRRESCR
jgi:hypothetical protein